MRRISPPRPQDPEWAKHGSCGSLGLYIGRGEDGEVVNDVWYPEGDDAGEQRAIARRICKRCPVRHDCLTDALGREWGMTSGSRRHGIRGGLSGGQRFRTELAMRGMDVEIGGEDDEPDEDELDEQEGQCEIAS